MIATLDRAHRDTRGRAHARRACWRLRSSPAARDGPVARRSARADEPRALPGARRRRHRGREAGRAGLRRRRARSSIRTGVSNVFNNIDDLFSAINDLLQGKLDKFGDDLGRVLLNTGFGLGGLFDLASMIGIERGNEDFGQTFGVWGFPQGPYLFVPLFGPTTVRDGTGWLVRVVVGPGRLHQRRSRCATVSTASATSTFARRRSRRAASSTPRRSTATLHPQRLSATASLSCLRRQAAAGTRGAVDVCHSIRAAPLRAALVVLLAAALCVAAPALAQEAPDAIVKRVANDVIATIKSDPAIQAGNEARIREVLEAKLLPQFRLHADDGARDGQELADRDARAAEARHRRVPRAARAHVFGRAQQLSQRDDRLQAAADESRRHRRHRAHAW